MEIYLLSASMGGLLGVALYAAITFFESDMFKLSYAALFLLGGLIVGLYIVFLLTRKYIDVYRSPKFNIWLLILLLVNQFLGIVSGLVIGIFASWLSLFPYSLIFGHPESTNWSPLVANLYVSLSVIIVIVSLGLFTNWFFKGGIAYLKKRTC